MADKINNRFEGRNAKAEMFQKIARHVCSCAGNV
jgi:hypothetical protein